MPKNQNPRLIKANEVLKAWFPKLSSDDKRDIIHGLPVTEKTFYAYFGGKGVSVMTAEWIVNYMEKNYSKEPA